jgi:hypothetical protein
MKRLVSLLKLTRDQGSEGGGGIAVIPGREEVGSSVAHEFLGESTRIYLVVFLTPTPPAHECIPLTLHRCIQMTTGSVYSTRRYMLCPGHRHQPCCLSFTVVQFSSLRIVASGPSQQPHYIHDI